MRPDRRFAACYATAIALFVATEMAAIRTQPDHLSPRTFTGVTRYAEAHVPAPARWAMRVAILGVATWAGVHLAEGLS